MLAQDGRPPDELKGPGRGSDLPSDLSQGEKHRTSDRDLPSNHSFGASCSATDCIGTAPNSSSLGVADRPSVPLSRVGCPAQPVGFVCEPYRLVAGPTCPLGHPMVRFRFSAVGVRLSAS